MVTIKTKQPNNETILKPGSRRYIPSEEVEKFEGSIERTHSFSDAGSNSGDHEFGMKEKECGQQNKHLDNTKIFKSSNEARDSQKSKKLD